MRAHQATNPSFFAAAALLVAACTKEPPPPPAAPPAPASAATAPSVAPAPNPCASIRAHNNAVTAAAEQQLQEAIDGGAIPREWLEGRTPMDAPCFETPAGAWAIKLNSVAHGGVTESRWSLVHVAKGGAEVAFIGPEDRSFYDACCSPTNKTTNIKTFDFDGDGDPEIGFDLEWEGVEGGSGVYHHLYTFRGGAIVPYPVPFEGKLGDEDGDGRPDLLLEHRLEDRMQCDGYAWEMVSGPSLLAHARPDGTFSTTDEVAAAYAKKGCPSRPAAIVVKEKRAGGRFVDEVRTAAHVICARAWGAPAAEIVAALERDCAAFTREDCDSVSKPRPDECRHRDVLIAWAKAAPVVF